MSTPLSRRDANVNTDAGDRLVEDIRPFAKRIMRPEVLGDLGGFGTLVEISKKYKSPVFVSGTNGVGTKLKFAFGWGKHDTVDVDLVVMNVDDISVQGAELLFLLDYFTCGKLDVTRAIDVIKGVAQGCERSGCALTSDEIAEIPGMYPEGEYDLVGFAVDVVEKECVINGRSIKAGGIALGLASNGAHPNGHSLVHKVIARDDSDLDAEFDNGKTLREIITVLTHLYIKPILAALEKFTIKGMAHITSGGIAESVSRILSENTIAQIDTKAWELPKLLRQLQRAGNVETQEMYRIFNCGVGMAIVIAEEDADAVQVFLTEQGETIYRLGIIRVRSGDKHQTQIVWF